MDNTEKLKAAWHHVSEALKLLTEVAAAVDYAPDTREASIIVRTNLQAALRFFADKAFTFTKPTASQTAKARES